MRRFHICNQQQPQLSPNAWSALSRATRIRRCVASPTVPQAASALFLLAFCPSVLDLREQFALPRS